MKKGCFLILVFLHQNEMNVDKIEYRMSICKLLFVDTNKLKR